MSGVGIRAATAEELPTVEGLLIEASEWLASQGSDQWQFPPHRDRIRKAIEHGECFLMVDDEGRATGTITVDDYADPEFWTEADDPGSALYVHRMATSRAAAGQDLGAVMLDWATKRAAQQGKAWLRLDAWKTNPGLHRYYERQGFIFVRLVDLDHRKSGALFQRPT
ncbi:GNAT family N-acetyltransferase [Streptomyces fradiae]|uniref:GNAT family N-acetyltransferase n=1 Tax=Streptomyces fradiae TaxID=1906 RepID=UPI00380A53A9